jgi:two-component system sensor histidine kinase UhpB
MTPSKKTAGSHHRPFERRLLSSEAKEDGSDAQPLTFTKILVEKGLTEKEIAEILVEIQERERTRIGYHLRDALLPLSAVANLYMEHIVTRTEKQKYAKERVKRTLYAAIDNIKDVSSELVFLPAIEYSLVQMVGALVNRIGQIKPICLSFTSCPYYKLSTIDPHLKIALYRIVQEQLNNIVKHSKSTEAEVRIYPPPGFLALLIADNGIGFDTNQTPHGNGLSNIAARVSLFNGEMRIVSSPGKGCQLNIRIPVS